MADQTSTPNPTPKKPKQVHHPVSQADLALLTTTEQYALNAKVDPYKTKILEEDSSLDDAAIAGLVQLITSTRGGQQTHVEGRVTVQSDTKAESQVEENLIELITEIRGRAKTTFGKNQQEKLPLYAVGVDLRTRKTLEGAADGLIVELGKSNPLNISATKIQKLTDLTKAYKDANVTQSDDNVTAKSQQIDVKGNVAKVGAWKRKLQIAINGAYPYNDPASAPHRTLFGLPPDKPYNPGIGASV